MAIKKPLFSLGSIVATPGALDLQLNFRPFLRKHVTGDWSEMSAEDQRENRQSVNRRLRIFSSYGYDPNDPSKKLWIITEADRSSTCVLLPSEY